MVSLCSHAGNVCKPLILMRGNGADWKRAEIIDSGGTDGTWGVIENIFKFLSRKKASPKLPELCRKQIYGNQECGGSVSF